MMADGYARVTGKPGVCLTSTGPGAANSMGGIGEAYFASAPVLHLTSTAEEELYERGLGTIHETKDQAGDVYRGGAAVLPHQPAGGDAGTGARGL